MRFSKIRTSGRSLPVLRHPSAAVNPLYWVRARFGGVDSDQSKALMLSLVRYLDDISVDQGTEDPEVGVARLQLII